MNNLRLITSWVDERYRWFLGLATLAMAGSIAWFALGQASGPGSLLGFLGITVAALVALSRGVHKPPTLPWSVFAAVVFVAGVVFLMPGGVLPRATLLVMAAVVALVGVAAGLVLIRRSS